MKATMAIKRFGGLGILCVYVASSICAVCIDPRSTMAEPRESAHVDEIVKHIGDTMRQLKHLTAEIVVESTGSSGLGAVNPRPAGKLLLKVLMAAPSRFRVEAFEGKRAVATMTGDGDQICEWDGRNNTWTRYPYSSRVSGSRAPRLISDQAGQLAIVFPIGRYAECWVGELSPYAAWLKSVISNGKVEILSQNDAKYGKLDVLVVRKKMRESAISISMKAMLAFSVDTHLPVWEQNETSGQAVILPVFGSKEKFRYSQVTTGRAVDLEGFQFAPPPGSRYIDPKDLPTTESPLVGKRAPEVSLRKLDGARVTLNELRDGKPLLLVFWATWCMPCNREIPTLVKLHQDFNKKGLSILAVSTDKNTKILKRFVKRRQLPYTVLRDLKGKASESYMVTGIPRTFLINKEGIVVKSWLGWSGEEEEAEIRKELAKLLP